VSTGAESSLGTDVVQVLTAMEIEIPSWKKVSAFSCPEENRYWTDDVRHDGGDICDGMSARSKSFLGGRCCFETIDNFLVCGGGVLVLRKLETWLRDRLLYTSGKRSCGVKICEEFR
jgi:hypothetical protein